MQINTIPAEAAIAGHDGVSSRKREIGALDLATLIARYDTRVPRYTSYPTAPHFSPAVDAPTYRTWLAGIAEASPVSLYLHVPFCERLCHYCGCHTTAINHVEPVLAYTETLLAEIALLGAALGRNRPVVHHVAWGGGTPTIMPPAQMRAVMDALRTWLPFSDDAEIAVEIDPRTAGPDVLDGLAAMGCTRASLGVQDLNPVVQQAVNRVQSREVTLACARGLRARGIRRINIDLMYGLPFQTHDSIRETVGLCAEFAPDRVAVFGYAHVPWMAKQQKLLPEEALPGAEERWAQMQATEDALIAGGYVPIGLDHYARPDDPLTRAATSGHLHRNFQGYTDDTAPVLLGLGASSIGSLPQGYAQNLSAVPAWRDAIRAGELPIARGIALSDEDRLRREVIETLMCQGQVDLAAIAARHGADPASLAAGAAARLAAMAADGLLDWDGTRITVHPAARPFVRNAAACFDTYLRPDQTRHARAV